MEQESSNSGISPKVILGFILSVVGVFLMFLLDEVIIGSKPIFSAHAPLRTLGFLALLGTYFAAVEYLLSRRNPHRLRPYLTTTLALNSAPMFVAGVSLFLERSGRPEALYVAMVQLVCSVLAAGFAAHHRETA